MDNYLRTPVLNQSPVLKMDEAKNLPDFDAISLAVLRWPRRKWFVRTESPRIIFVQSWFLPYKSSELHGLHSYPVDCNFKTRHFSLWPSPTFVSCLFFCLTPLDPSCFLPPKIQRFRFALKLLAATSPSLDQHLASIQPRKASPANLMAPKGGILTFSVVKNVRASGGDPGIPWRSFKNTALKSGGKTKGSTYQLVSRIFWTINSTWILRVFHKTVEGYPFGSCWTPLKH